jgi:hypothetical protein
MRTPVQIKADLIDSLNHIRGALTTLRAQSGIHRPFTFPDAHKISEGLFLSAWTHWEEFLHELLEVDLATDPQGFLRKDISRFRVRAAPERLAERLLSHPDAPDKFVEWDYSNVYARAESFLAAGHRYPQSLPRSNDLAFLKRIRNGIAHRSDRAKESFLSLARGNPFNLHAAQMRGITVGRFVFSHHWNGGFILEASLQLIEDSATILVP